jgi:putative ABC transport system permease protein
MQKLFGVPVGTLALVLVVVLLAALTVITALAARNRILVTMGARNAWRRKGRSALIVTGLMLGTAIITSALVTGDTISHTIRSSVTTALGNTDEMVAAKGTQSTSAAALGVTMPVDYFDQGRANAATAAIRSIPHVDAVTPAIIEGISVQDLTSRQNEPRVVGFAAADLRGLQPIVSNGRAVALDALAPGEVYLNEHAASELGARIGDRIVVLAGMTTSPAVVRGIVSFKGGGTDASGLLAPMATMQSMLGKPDQVNRIIVSNDGGLTAGSRYSDQVMRALPAAISPFGLEAKAVKHDGIRDADKIGNTFMSLFTTFGMFSISAGLLLIFLIFVMLAAERRGEMGIARAVGMQRRHLVQSFLFEGTLYDVAAAVVGVVLGVGVAFAMVSIMAGALNTENGLNIERSAQVNSLVVGGCIGILLTLVVVAASAWRVSRLNIVTAIRNLTEPTRKPRKRTWVMGVLGIAMGALLTVSGRSAAAATTFMLGVSIVAISVASLVRTAGARPRPTYTATGIALVAWWSLPFSVIRVMVPGLKMDFSMWIVAGLMVVLGSTWVLIYNADILLSGVMSVFGRARSAAPVLKTSIAYPLRSRFRTGITLAMFTLVVFTLVVGSATTNAFTKAFDDVSSFGGGFDVRATVSPFSPVADMATAVRSAPGVPPGDVRAVSAQSVVPVNVAQVDVGRKAESYIVRGVDDAFLTTTTYGFATMATGYHSARQVWGALARDPNLAVVDSTIVPRRNNWGFAPPVALRLSGLYLEDKSFTPVKLAVTDTQTGAVRTYTVIGVTKDVSSMLMPGVTVSQSALTEFGARANPTIYYYLLRPGGDAAATAKRLESAFLANGMQADSLRKLLSDSIASNMTMNRIVLGFMGLGLIVGIAALGVISARSVVERRQQIGVLRAIGFQRRMVQASFLIESSFISLVAILVGTGLGLLCARNVIADAASNPTWGSVSFVVPWLELAIVFIAVYAAALLTTYGPSRRAAGTYPAEALRYQ